MVQARPRLFERAPRFQKFNLTKEKLAFNLNPGFLFPSLRRYTVVPKKRARLLSALSPHRAMKVLAAMPQNLATDALQELEAIYPKFAMEVDQIIDT